MAVARGTSLLLTPASGSEPRRQTGGGRYQLGHADAGGPYGAGKPHARGERMRERETVRIDRTHGQKLPALWERGGGMTNTGGATIICGPQGRPKRPVYIRRAGHLACDDHALFVVRPGDHVIRASHHRGDFCREPHYALAVD